MKINKTIMKKTKYFFCVLLLSCFIIPTMNAQDFVYTPKNPAFGGDTFNYNWLLSSAQTQNLLEAEETSIGRSTLETFTESLNRQLLNNISRQLITTEFGEEGLTDGTYTLGNFTLDVVSTLDGLSITILDTTQGEQTQIIIPYF